MIVWDHSYKLEVQDFNNNKTHQQDSQISNSNLCMIKTELFTRAKIKVKSASPKCKWFKVKITIYLNNNLVPIAPVP